jgi:hypothetical protein
MNEVAALKPPPENEQTIRVFKAVNHALNDVDRRLYPPVETIRERHDQIIEAYRTVELRHRAAAEACGLSNWLRYSVASRSFSTLIEVARLQECRALFEEMERLGHPHVNSLICIRMIWCNLLIESNLLEEARIVGQQLVADLNALHGINSSVFGAELERDLADFRRRLSI